MNKKIFLIKMNDIKIKSNIQNYTNDIDIVFVSKIQRERIVKEKQKETVESCFPFFLLICVIYVYFR
jgi:aspartate carbamoyltransferase catalytic subunit